ncbi:unnamed protein product [Tilletia controversa]|uniref:Uncharacterized protein n=3 Tax=Tilletia TaxID=13289 RepID=A0A8X7SW63_9BASI|nr:hypothetical protein CF336_g4370 [Tilletia laevis]KAE8196184.1 hypothetical protein CF328_g4210 [Tilletia controversa]KAE8259921.1 hypothetical protein A4X03_0g3953 [Tilletia caries]KAE8201278.1 hypothetical protein CF335_g3774 [Tilletia laevis]KAE8246988.1 hypothetical protein A4X06_0g4774 [Tilletia controversa]
MPSQTSTADIYVNCLYSPGDGYPLWNPSPLRTGAIGYIRDGSFFTLYNIEEGPPAEIHPAADPSLVGRRRSTPANHVLTTPSAGTHTLSPPPIGVENGAAESVSSGGNTTVAVGSAATAGRRASDAAGGGSSSPSRVVSATEKRRGSVMTMMRNNSQQQQQQQYFPPPGSSLSDPVSPSYEGPFTNAVARSTGSVTPPFTSGPIASPTMLALGLDPQRSPRQRERDLPPEAPMPLQIEYEDLRRFDAGPRSSSTYTCLGFSAGANVPGAPVGGMWSFKSGGGDGALLIPRDPTEREQLRHVGNLKIYLKTHLRWIAYRYCISEDIEADDVALVFSQDRTSDWACAVSRNTTKGAQVDFEVFSLGKASVWGEWRTAMTASQRGPHRGGPPVFNPNFALGAAGARMQAASMGGGGHSGGDSSNPAAGFGFSVGGLSASFSPSLEAQVKMETGDGDSGAGDSQSSNVDASLDVRITAGASSSKGGDGNGGGRTRTNSDQSPASQPGFSVQGWPLRNPHPADQAITIRRITMKHRLGFLPASIRASAGPRPDQRREPEDDGEVGAVPSGERGRIEEEEERCRRKWTGIKAFDPLDLLHEYILTRAPTARASIASDAECAFLLRAALLRRPRSTTAAGLSDEAAVVRELLFRTADAAADVHVDTDGIATIELRIGSEAEEKQVITPTAVERRAQTQAGDVKAAAATRGTHPQVPLTGLRTGRDHSTNSPAFVIPPTFVHSSPVSHQDRSRHIYDARTA